MKKTKHKNLKIIYMNKLNNKTKGITLISLVITIIILLILVSVTLNVLIGSNGLFNRANETKKRAFKAQAQENIQLALTEIIAEKGGDKLEDNDIIDEKSGLHAKDKNININKDNVWTGTYTNGIMEIGFTIDNLNYKVILDEEVIIGQGTENYYIIYDANGGENPPESQLIKENNIITASEPSRGDDYIFVGWGTNSDAKEVEYKAGDSYVGNGSVTLYALWARKVEYIESTGTQYIDTNVAPNNANIKVEIKYKYVSNLETGNDSIIGSRDGNATTRFYPTSLGGKDIDRHVFGSNELLSTYDFDEHTIIFNDASHNCYLDENLLGNLQNNFVPHNQSMYLFGLNCEGNFSYQSASRIYYCKIWDNNNLIRDYIPVIDMKSEPCLYDIENEVFYYNNNSSGEDFNTNLINKEVKVNRNYKVTEENLRQLNSILDNETVSDIVIKDSNNNTVGSTLSNYDIYKVSFKINDRSINQTMITKPQTSMTLTNKLDNAGFELDLSNYYNAVPSKSTSIKRTGNYSMYYTCSNSQAFLRMRYGDIGAKDNKVYIRAYVRTDDTSLVPGIYVYEDETNAEWPNSDCRASKWIENSKTYNNWAMWSELTVPTSNNYSYFTLQLAQSNGNGSGNVYWDDLMALVLDNSWDSTPTAAWLDKMIPDFTGTQTISW